MLARVLAWVEYINLPGYIHVFQPGKDRSRLPNQNRLNSRFLHERASRVQSSLIGSICQYNAHWMRKCACMEPSNMRTKGLSLFLYHSSPRVGKPTKGGGKPTLGDCPPPPRAGASPAPTIHGPGGHSDSLISWCLYLQALCLS